MARKGAKARNAAARLRVVAYEERTFSDDHGVAHDAAPSQTQKDIRTVLRELARLRRLVRYYAPEGVT